MSQPPSSSCLITSGAEKRVRELVNRLLDEAREPEGAERRAAARNPYFGPVSISLSDAPHLCFSAFARDLSHLGIGLLHVMPLACGEVVVTLPSQSGAPIRLRTQIMWCEDCGDGWYTSGGRFLDVPDGQMDSI